MTAPIRALLCLAFLMSNATKAGTVDSVLLQEARKRFGEPLSPADQKLFESVDRGDVANYRPNDVKVMSPDEVKKDLLDNAAGWGPERTVQADRIAWLCATPGLVPLITHKGVRILGAKIEGELDLTDAKIPFPLSIESSSIPKRTDFSGAEIWSLSLNGSSIGKLDARSLRAKVDIRLTNGFMTKTTTDLSNAQIGGDLDLTKGEFTYEKEVKKEERDPNFNISIYGSYLTVGRDLLMGGTFRGLVQLTGAKIFGDINCENGDFENKSNPKYKDECKAIDFGGLVAKGNVYFSPKVKGLTELSNSRIDGDFNCESGQFNADPGPFIADPQRKGSRTSFRAHGLNVGGDANLRYGFYSNGKVDLTSAKIGGSLDFTGGKIELPKQAKEDLERMAKNGKEVYVIESIDSSGDDVVLDLRTSSVGHDLVMGPKFKTFGRVRMNNASIGGDFDCRGEEFNNLGFVAIDASAAVIAGDVLIDGKKHKTDKIKFVNGNLKFNLAKVGRQFVVRNCNLDATTILDLRSAEVGTIAHDLSTERPTMIIGGFTYSQIHESLKEKKMLLDWLQLQDKDNFSVSSYVHLATTLNKIGQVGDANDILIEKEKKEGDERWKANPQLVDFLWYRVLGPIIKFGYDPLGAFLWGIGFVGSGWYVFYKANAHKFLVAKATETREFSPLVYSIDLFTPVISFYEREDWSVATQQENGFNYWLLLFRIYWMAYIIMGWVISSLLVAGLLGLVHH